MSGAPKTASTLLPLPSERALLGEEPFGQPQETITQPTQAPSTQRRRDRTGRHGRGGLPGPSGHGRTRCRPTRPHSQPQQHSPPWPRTWPAIASPHCRRSAQAAGHRAASAQAVKYTVRSGDSLSAIAGRVYHNPDAWPVLYWANHSQIRWANIINAGQVLKVPAKPAKIPSAPGLLGPAAPAPTLAAAPAEATAVSPAYASAARGREPTRAARQAARSVSASWPASPAGTRRS